jgi:hypothetical protein
MLNAENPSKIAIIKYHSGINDSDSGVPGAIS